jgi:ribosomal protein L29
MIEEKKQYTYVQILQEQLRNEVDHNETLLAYIRLLNAQVSGNTHKITDLQHKIAKALGVESDKA